MTKERLARKDLLPVRKLRTMIEAWRQENEGFPGVRRRMRHLLRDGLAASTPDCALKALGAMRSESL